MTVPIPMHRRLAKGWAIFPLALFAVDRAVLLAASYLSLRLIPTLERSGGSSALRDLPALDGLCRWDCGWFEQLANVGYRETTDTNFWPLYPLLARGLSELGIPVHLALLIWPNLAGLGAFLVIYRIFLKLEGEAAARWGLTTFAAFPFAFFQATGYPESLMVFFGALSVLLALRGNHLWAGLALGLGTLARHVTILAGPALAAAQLRQRGLKRFFASPALAGLLLPFLVASLYLVYQRQRFGDPLAFWAARKQWGETAWWSPLEVFRNDFPYPHFYLYMVFALLPTAGSIALAFRKRWLELAAFGLFMMGVLWTVGAAGLGRYSASCWPAFLPIGLWLSRRPVFQVPMTLTLAMAQAVFFNLFVHQVPIL